MERRDVLHDFRTAFGEEPTTILGVVLMTDTDDTRSHSTAYYGDIRFFPDADAERHSVR